MNMPCFFIILAALRAPLPTLTPLTFCSCVKKDGMVWNTLGGEALKSLKAKLARYEQDWIAKAKEAGVDGEAALKMFRAEIAAYKK